jgi:hypothetical protein
MLKWKSIIQCGRVAFGFGGIHDEDEGRDIAGFRDVTPASPVTRVREIAVDPFEDVIETDIEPDTEDLFSQEGSK